MTDWGEVIFKYRNPEQQVETNFGLSLKKYIGHIKKTIPVRKMIKGKPNKEDLKDMTVSEGPYILKPEWREPEPKPYS